MEHDGALSPVALLSCVSVALVVERLLPGTFVPRRNGHVFPGASLDGEPSRGCGRRRRFRLQWSVAESAYVAESRGNLRLDAVGDLERGAGMAAWRAVDGVGRNIWRPADACGRP